VKQVLDLRCEGLARPLNVATSGIVFSWQISVSANAPFGSRVRVASQPELIPQGRPDMWDSGLLHGRQVRAEYGGQTLTDDTRYFWSVEAPIPNGSSYLSDIEEFETAPGPDVWQHAGWVTKRRTRRVCEDFRPAPYLRHVFEMPFRLVRARLHVTAAGMYVAFVNGERVGHDHLAPGWTDYRVRVPYRTYDVTGSLSEGANCLAIVVGDGWYSGNVGPYWQKGHYGAEPAAMAVLDLEGPGGQRTRIPSTDRWKASYGPILMSDLLLGEFYDSRLELDGWLRPDFDDDSWSSADRVEGPSGRLVPAFWDAVHVVAELPAIRSWPTIPGSCAFDLGRNFAGHVRITLGAAPAGSIVRLQHGEILDKEGRPYTGNLRGARAVDTYVCSGAGTVRWEPSFTYHGFRYVEVTADAAVLDALTITGVAVSSVDAFAPFACDNDTINSLSANVARTLESNYVEVPTDCPQRDERLGWMGDAQIFAPTATLYADVYRFLNKWLVDIRDAQRLNGAFLDVAPLLYETSDGSPGSGDAGVVIPWELYRRFGDLRVLERSYEGVTRWIDYVGRKNPDNLWANQLNNNWGDWLSLERTEPELVATAYYHRTVTIAASMARRLGRHADSRHYGVLAGDILDAFRAAFCDGNGRLYADTQCANTLGLAFRLLSQSAWPAAFESLVESIEGRGCATTGFYSVAWLLPVLSWCGRPDLGTRLLLSSEYPSWRWQVERGATTFWERWDGVDPSGAFQDPGMNSFNHCALGSIGQWFVEGLGGIRPSDEAAGYGKVLVAPEMTTAVRRASAVVHAPLGDVTCQWQTTGTNVRVEVHLPAGASGSLVLPAGTTSSDESLLAHKPQPDVRAFEASLPTLPLTQGRTSFEGKIADVSEDVLQPRPFQGGRRLRRIRTITLWRGATEFDRQSAEE
jgi:alpha-L-rhamnosidase